MLLDWLKATERICILFLGVFAFAAAAQAGPEDGRIVNGSGSISQSGTHTDIHQNSDFLATHWGSFNIAANESVQAHQPAASSRLLIRVDGGAATNITGSYTSNGITILENQNGVQFSRGAIVNVGGLLATSSRISGVAGANWQLDGVGGAVVNHGQIVAGAGGAILAAVKVQNTGDITAKGGDVALGAGSSFTVDFAGSMVGFEITKAASGASLVTTGKIEAQGGVVALSAQEAQAVRTNVVSVGGVVKATKLERRGGVVYLSGGDEGIAEVSGDVSASDKVQTTGEYVVVKEGAVLTAPEILVGGDFQGRGDVQTAKRTLVEAGALLDAGAEGRVIVWSDDVTWFNGNINVPGGFAEVSGKNVLATVNLPGINVGASGTLLLDPWVLSIVDNTATHEDLPPDGLGIQFEDFGVVEGTTTMISAQDVGNFVGALELQARRGIRISANITSTTLTSLTLRAQDADGEGGTDNTQNGGMGGDANNITFFGTTVLNLGGASLNLIAGVINIRTAQAANTTITARGGLTFRYTRDGLDQAVAETTHITTGALTLGTGTTLIYTFGDPEAATDCTRQPDICSITRTDADVEISSGNLTASISLMVGIGTGDLSFAGTGPIIISARTVTITAGTINITDRALTITTTTGSLTLAATITTTGNITLNSTRIMLSGATTLTGATITITAPKIDIDTHALTITASTDVLTLNLNAANPATITGTGAAELSVSAPIIMVTGLEPILNVPTVSLTLTRAAITDPDGVIIVAAPSFGSTAPFDTVNSMITTLNITTAADQTYRGWMAGTNRNLTLDTRGVITIGAAAINLGTGNLFFGGANLILTNPAGLTITAGNFQFTGGAIGPQDGVDVPQFMVIASGDIILDSTIQLPTARVEFRADTGNIMPAADRAILGIDPPLIMANSLLMRQMGAFADDLINTASRVSGAATFHITRAGVNQTIHSWMTALGGTDFSLRGAGGAVLDSITTEAALTRTSGAIDLRATAITLGGALTGTEVRLHTNMITGDSANLVAIHAMTGDITATRADGTSRPALATDVTGFSLTRSRTFGGRGSLPFTLTASVLSAITAITLSTRSEQFVLDWMIAPGRNLTITSSSNMRVDAAIGASEPDRNLGTGSLSLTSTGGVVIIVADITTGGDITLSGVTGGINLNGGAAKTLSGTAITLTGNARSNRDLTITASGALTLNGDITGTRALSLSVFGNTEITLGRALTLTGGAITLTGAAMGAANLTIAASGTLTLNSNITLTGTTSILDLSGAGVIGNGSTARVLTAGTVSLTQEAAFGSPALFTFGADTGSLELTTDAAQNVHDWMINDGISLTVTSAGNVFVRSAIELGTGALSLRSTRGSIRIFAGITTTGNITLNGAAGISFNNRAAKTLSGAIITLIGGAQSNRALTLNASMVRLRQVAAFGGVPQFIFSGTDSLVLITEAAQVVHDWMIAPNRNLTITSASTARVNAAIGDGVVGRDLGMGSLTLRSGTAVRILVNITTGGNITLIGGTGGINFNGRAAKTLSGGTVTLTGNARSNRALTLTAASGALTLSGGIALTGARVLSLSGSGGIALGGALTLTGGAITLNSAVTGAANLTITTRGTLTLNNNINLTGAVLTLALSGAGAIGDGSSPAVLTASTVRLRQVDVFSGTQSPFNFGTTPSLELTTDAAQVVHDWMIADGRNLTVTSALNVIVRSAIGAGLGVRDLGDGSLILRSTGGVVRIFADISTMGDLTLNGGTNGINLKGGVVGVRTLAGAIVTLTGAARSNRALTLTATTFALGDAMSTINVGANVLTITAGSNLPASLTGDDRLTAGDFMFSFTCPDTTCVDITP